MGKVKLLTTEVANKIAAGEVIERPASVVKELVENSIDAGSTKIEVKVKKGGKDLIQVVDNGEGMSPEDAKLAFKRHATSKIEEANDLFALRTLGFRGEALPSIAAVSRLKITTRQEDSLSGTRLRLLGGEVEKEESCGCRVGTNILVKDLFFNTPVRYKYLKQTSTEIGHISNIVNRLSLAYPNISFSLEHNGRKILETTGNGNLIDVIFNIYGRKVAKEMIEVNYQDNYMELYGFVSNPNVTRSSRKHQSYFVNNRFIKSGLMSKAVQEAYHTLLTVDRYPIVVLKLKLNPILVDVNVHPTKLEAKFSRGSMVYELVKQGVSKAIKESDLVPKLSLNQKKKQDNPEDKYEQDELKLTAKTKDVERSNEQEEAREEKPTKSKQDKDSNNRQKNYQSKSNSYKNNRKKSNYQSTKKDSKELRAKKIDKLFGGSTKEQSAKVKNKEIKQEDRIKESKNDYTKAKRGEQTLIPLGQINQTYIVAQGEDGMYIVDQHAAHERMLYNELVANFKKAQVNIQELLVPIKLELTHQEAGLLEQKREDLERLGFILEAFGGTSYLIQGVPVQLYNLDNQQLILDSIYQILEEPTTKEGYQLIEDIIIMIACRTAIKGGDKLSQQEMKQLLADVKSQEITNCPHGRPVMMHLSTQELAKEFKRT